MSPLATIAGLGLALLVPTSGAAEKSPGLPKNSPFMPPAGAGPAAAAANETIEFAGIMSSGGKRTDLIFYDKTAKKSHWIAKGETKEGISVLNYDERRDQVVVKVNGVEKVLPLRKATGPVAAPHPVAPVPTGFNIAPPVQPQILPAAATVAMPPPSNAGVITMPPAPAPMPVAPKQEGPVTPETRARQETEARMLVSDLLEIGMAQRKAYEEAQRRAAQPNAGTPPAQSVPDPAATPGQKQQ